MDKMEGGAPQKMGNKSEDVVEVQLDTDQDHPDVVLHTGHAGEEEEEETQNKSAETKQLVAEQKKPFPAGLKIIIFLILIVILVGVIVASIFVSERDADSPVEMMINEGDA